MREKWPQGRVLDKSFHTRAHNDSTMHCACSDGKEGSVIRKVLFNECKRAVVPAYSTSLNSGNVPTLSPSRHQRSQHHEYQRATCPGCFVAAKSTCSTGVSHAFYNAQRPQIQRPPEWEVLVSRISIAHDFALKRLKDSQMSAGATTTDDHTLSSFTS